MKKTLLKTALILLLVNILFLNKASSQQYMHINKKDGTVIEIAIADIQKLTFDLTVAIQQYPEIAQKLIKIKTSPNPSTNYFMLDYSVKEAGEVLIEIFSLQGVLVSSISEGYISPGENQRRIDIQNLKTGTYLCRVRQNNEFVTQKIIVKK
ncbi:MAG: T9SS type A sorting domain-containing protein [Bacteroidales bacterium]|nr:T9SS type A sorting domain-containing protein [Bacteroidales bacterium]